MNYLYGDSTASPLKSNFLEFLRDATDFAVFALQADHGIERGKERIRALSAEADAELQRLGRFVASVSRAIDEGDKGASESPASRCAARLAESVASAHRTTTEEVQQSLAAAIAQVEAEEANSRGTVRDALATLLAPHDPHGASRVVRLSLRESGTYEASLAASTPFGLEWTFALGVPDDNIWHAPIRIDTIVPHLEIHAPQLTGFFSKEVKTRPQKLDRHVVTDFVDKGTTVAFKLRPEPGVDVGIDAAVDVDAKAVTMTRVGPAEDASIGAFDVHADDVAAIVALATSLRAGANAVRREALEAATLDGQDFTALPRFGELVERLVANMAPIVREISDRSLTPTELVIRRALANDRREEIFVPKATLREKYAALPPALAAAFRPLGLEKNEASKARVSEAPPHEAPPVRAQLAPSQPPPAPSAPPALPRVSTARPPPGATAAVPPPMASSPPGTHASAPPARSAVPPAPEAVALPSDSLLEVAPDAGSGSIPESKPGPTARNEVLVGILKRVALLVRNGRADEAYGQYAELYASEPFADYRPDDQRLALRLMLVPKTPPTTKSEAVLDAHRAAATRLEALIAAVNEPSDYELLGIARLALEDTEAATAALRKGLELERERSPGSDLCGNLLRRLSAL